MKKYLGWKLLTILIVTLVLGVFDLPASVQSKILPFSSETLSKAKISLGLDLQGGSQLDYKIDLRKVPEKDQASIIEGVQEVIEKRVNRLGVAEPNIYRSEIGGENHIIVELAQTATLTQEDVDLYLEEKKTLDELTDDEKKYVSLEKAKATVGKTIQLEFKEEKGQLDPAEKDKIKENALAALKKIQNGESFSIVGQEESQAYPGKVKYEKSEFTFASDLPSGLIDTMKKLKVGEYTDELIELSGDYNIDEFGNTVQESSLAIVKLDDEKEEIKYKKVVDVSHILIAYKGLATADASVTRTEDEAYDLAKELVKKLEDGADFSEIAKTSSDDQSNKDLGGKLDPPVRGTGKYVADFEKAALGLAETGDISDIVKTEFGYHIIKANSIETDVKEMKYQYEIIPYSTTPDPWKETGLTGEHFVHADVQLDNFFQPYVSIQFNEEGSKLFEEITGRNINKRVAIFVGGEQKSAPNVNEKIVGGSAQISGDFTNEEAKALARDLNTGAIPAPIILAGEYTIGATLGQEALSASLWAGSIGILLVIVFMILYYRLPGIIASVALGIYGVIFLFLLKAHLHLGISLGIALIVFGFLIVKIVNNKDSGWEKFLSFLLSCFGFFFITFLLKSGVVVTLAGIAGIIMSFGMAVDANILIFERLKEELKEGKPLSAAVESAFDRAWSAIRDSNFCTLLTCAILFYFGSSIIRGFAFNLAAGVLVSMFTAITITKTLMHGLIGKKIAQNFAMFGIKENKKPLNIDFIKKSKTWFYISGVSAIIGVFAIAIFGLNLGIDFKGGSLMEFKFEENITKEKLIDTFKTIESEINTTNEKTPVATTEKAETTPEVSLSADTLSKVDLTSIHVIESGVNTFIIKSKYLSAENQDRVIAKMQEKLPKFNKLRVTTIGPTVGTTLLHKGIIAIILTMVMIIVYLALAFRKIPKEVNPWRFGVTAIIALVHDIIIVTGVFAVLGYLFSVEIDALFITAMLTVLGYSVHDTIVVFDRLRDNLLHHNDSLEKTANDSLNQTLARSINTSVSVALALVAVLIFGSKAIFYFVLALTLGITVGTYSSIFVATPLLVYWNNRKK